MEEKQKIIESEDVVALEINGPEMLVEIVDQDNVAHCVWFSHTYELQKDSFEVRFLHLVKKGKKMKVN